MSFQGLDPVLVRQVADGLERQAVSLEQVVTTVDGLSRNAGQHWQGADVADFQQWWVGQHRPSLSAVVKELHAACVKLRQQVAEQEQASGQGNSGHQGSSGMTRGNPEGVWIDPSDPKVTFFEGKKTFVEGFQRDSELAGGNLHLEAMSLKEEHKATLGKDGLVVAGGMTATAFGATYQRGFGEHAKAEANVWAGAKASGGVKVGPSGASLNAQAFAGVSAGVEGQVGDNNARIKGGAEVSAGIGFEGKAEGKIEDGKLKFGAKIGGALGIGGKVSFGMEVNVAPVLDAAKEAGKVADSAGKTLAGWLGGRF